jgi:hypothetical protein
MGWNLRRAHVTTAERALLVQGAFGTGVLIRRLVRHRTGRHFAVLVVVAVILACLPATALAVLKPQAITFTSTVPSSAVVSGPTYTVTATGGGSGNPVTFKIDATSSSVCSISGSAVSFTGAGTCTIDANQAGGGEFEPAPQKQQSFAVGKGAQAINYTSTAPSSAKVSGPTYTVTATGGESHNAVTFTIDAASASVCTISGATVSFTGAGMCTIDANQAGNANYEPAPLKQQSFVVGKGAQTIAFTSTAPSSATVGGSQYTVTATATSGLAVSFSSGTPMVCTVSGATVSFVGAGQCTIDANQAGNANYEPASEKQQPFEVAKGTQAINFTSTAPSLASVGGSPYTVAAEGGESHNAVTFTIGAASASVCTISGTTVSFTGVGTCTIDANQTGNANYNAAPQIQQVLTVGKGAQAISFTSTPPGSAAVGASPYVVAAEGGGSHNGLAFTIDASSVSVCTISGTSVSFIGEGTCTIDVNQAGNSNYEAAQAQQSFTVGKGSQTIKFTSTPPSSATVGGSQYTVTATATSGLAVSFSSGTPMVCTVSGATVSFVGAGTCTIDANQAGSAGYKAALQVEQSFEVGIVIVVPVTPSTPAPIVVHVLPPNSSFKTLGAVFNPASHMITFTESVAEPGTFSWLLTFQNGKFGVFGRTSAKCKNGFVKLGGKCRPSKIVFARGSASVTSAGTVTFALKPTPSALKALKNAYKLKKSLPVAMTLTFQSVRSTSPVSRLLALTVRTR